MQLTLLPEEEHNKPWRQPQCCLVPMYRQLDRKASRRQWRPCQAVWRAGEALCWRTPRLLVWSGPRELWLWLPILSTCCQRYSQRTRFCLPKTAIVLSGSLPDWVARASLPSLRIIEQGGEEHLCGYMNSRMCGMYPHHVTTTADYLFSVK